MQISTRKLDSSPVQYDFELNAVVQYTRISMHTCGTDNIDTVSEIHNLSTVDTAAALKDATVTSDHRSTLKPLLPIRPEVLTPPQWRNTTLSPPMLNLQLRKLPQLHLKRQTPPSRSPSSCCRVHWRVMMFRVGLYNGCLLGSLYLDSPMSTDQETRYCTRHALK